MQSAFYSPVTSCGFKFSIIIVSLDKNWHVQQIWRLRFIKRFELEGFVTSFQIAILVCRDEQPVGCCMQMQMRATVWLTGPVNGTVAVWWWQ
jgi:hypothetical protein